MSGHEGVEWIDQKKLCASLELLRLDKSNRAHAINNLVLDHVISMVNVQEPAHEYGPELLRALSWRRRRMRSQWLDWRLPFTGDDARSLLCLDDALIAKYERMIAANDGGSWYEDFMFGVLEAAGLVLDEVMDPGR